MKSLAASHAKINTHRPLLFFGTAFLFLAVAPLVFLWLSPLGINNYVQWIIIGYSLTMVMLGTTTALSLQVSRRIGLLVLFAAQLFWFAIPALGGIADPAGYGDKMNYYLSEQIIVLTTGYLFFFTVVATATYWFFNTRFRSHVASQIYKIQAPPVDKQMLWFVIILVVLGLLPFFASGGNLTTIVSGIFSSRSSIKPWHSSMNNSNPLYTLGRSSLVTAGMLALIYTFKKQDYRKRLPWAVLFALSFVITYFDSGTRSWTLMMVGPPILLFLRNSLFTRKFNRWFIAGPLLIACVLWLAQFQQKFRGSGINTDVIMAARNVELNDNDFFSETAVAVSLVPERMDYLRESAVVLFLTNPIPRAFWSGKPYSQVVVMYGLGRTGRDEYLDKGNSRMPSVVGQFYMSWGLWGIFIVSVFYGSLLSLCDSLLRREGPSQLVHVWAATVCVWLFISCRGMFPGFHYPVILIGLIILYQMRFARMRARPRRVPLRPLPS